jgi:hypothetical protein
MDSNLGIVRKPGRKCPSLNGLRITIRSAIHEWPHTIWRPLERSLPDNGKGFGQLGYAIAVISIRQRIGKRYSGHHGKHPPTAWRSLPELRRQQEDAGDGDGDEAARVPLLLTQLVACRSEFVTAAAAALHSWGRSLPLSVHGYGLATVTTDAKAGNGRSATGH